MSDSMGRADPHPLTPFMNSANLWEHLGNGARVHRTAVVGLQPLQSGAFAREVKAQPLPWLGAHTIIGPHAIIYAGAVIEDGTVICPNAQIREGARIGARCVIGIGVQIGYDVIIGDDCQIMDYAHLSGGTVVGDRCFISVRALAVNDDRPRGYKWKGVTPVRIGSDVVVGAGACLRPGITVGDGATIAMGAVVTRDVAPAAMVKGPVARPVDGRPDAVERCAGALGVAIAEGAATLNCSRTDAAMVQKTVRLRIHEEFGTNPNLRLPDGCVAGDFRNDRVGSGLLYVTGPFPAWLPNQIQRSWRCDGGFPTVGAIITDHGDGYSWQWKYDGKPLGEPIRIDFDPWPMPPAGSPDR